jgi:hypothetical protein
VEIACSSDGPSAFQLQFHADRTSGFSEDFALLSSPLLQPWTRALIGVTLGTQPTILMDGFITHQELAHDKESSASTLTVTGEDVSILMDRVQYSMQYPQMGASAIAFMVLSKYSLIGINPVVTATEADLIPALVERTPVQSSTDREYLNQLASPFGYHFYVTPGPAPLQNTARWGPPLHTGSLAPAFSMDLGPATNIEQINFKLDSLAPVQVYGMIQDTITEEDLPLATLTSTRLHPFAARPALNPLGLLQRRDLATDPRMSYALAYVNAQNITNLSTDRAVTVQGQLDTVRYGSVLQLPGLVDVRGAGRTYDGRYCLLSVTHSIQRGAYKQSFTLAREGTGSTVSRVSP